MRSTQLSKTYETSSRVPPGLSIAPDLGLQYAVALAQLPISFRTYLQVPTFSSIYGPGKGDNFDKFSSKRRRGLRILGFAHLFAVKLGFTGDPIQSQRGYASVQAAQENWKPNRKGHTERSYPVSKRVRSVSKTKK